MTGGLERDFISVSDEREEREVGPLPLALPLLPSRSVGQERPSSAQTLAFEKDLLRAAVVAVTVGLERESPFLLVKRENGEEEREGKVKKGGSKCQLF